MASFNIEQKEAIVSQLPKNGCCRRSILHGALAVRGECIDAEVLLRLENEAIAAAMEGLIFEFFGKECSRLPRKKGERSVLLSFRSPSAVRYISELRAMDKIEPLPKCKDCSACFLQGIFLAIGHLSSPEKQYCLELYSDNNDNALYSYLLDLGIEMHRAVRGGKNILYLRSSGAIEDFFANAQMNVTAFSLMNAKIESDIRNDANRLANCETGNIAKAVDASARQLKAIRWLEKRGLLSSLPEELEKTARLRIEHRDLSLSQLAACSAVPISKPGLSHRLSRIVSIAERLMAEEKVEKKKNGKE